MKSHYHVLDGLRGTAAFSVFAYHILEMLVPGLEQNPMRHTHLAVDLVDAPVRDRQVDGRRCDVLRRDPVCAGAIALVRQAAARLAVANPV